MEKVKCDCGHVNPYGTYLCESCGKPQMEDNQTLVDMRYEGVARRSQTYRKTFIDKIWNFFSSVKVGIWIIVLLLIASAIGTIFPQEMYLPPGERAAIYYEQEYGILGKLYFQLGLHNMYSSWWYLLLIASLGVSLVICSLDRVVPLHRALKTQRVKRHTSFLNRQRLFSKSDDVIETAEEDIQKAEKALREKKYKIYKEDGNLLAEKYRFSRWGPYVNHVGLIIFLVGCMLRFFPAMYIDENIWIREGEEVVIRGTDGEYFLRNDQFIVEYYDEEDERFRDSFERTGGQPVVETYQTSATLLKKVDTGTVGVGTELEEVKQYDIRVNDPLTFEGFSLYQVDYKLNELAEFTFTIESNLDDYNGDLSNISFEVDLYNPEMVYELDGGYRVEIFQYFPNFYINNRGEPDTRNRIPDNPRFIFEVFSPEVDHEEERGELSLVGVQINEPLVDEGEVNDYSIRMIDVDMNHVTALTVRRDRTLPILFVGGTIFMIGLIQGSYWHHRRIWLQNRKGVIWVAGHANKNWHGLKKDIEFIIEGTSIPMPEDQTDESNMIEEIEGVKGNDDATTK
ncbi:MULTISPECIES: cytochrome c biogenesis protein ResB [Bacillaceae]|uniref:Cytochrome c biogenesis protein ResB n=1 Tax=Evansella alkalicola TaxID=745819 RepID=A0ABS6K2F1_9BACI|nr:MULTISPECIES: cytochrome c biogenesis protein ResB [Bacillaceae]MBU9724005.1 cytochrome c biogenesis protein ResB [Bacillus alkalicola]